jgi:hypothetical protein
MKRSIAASAGARLVKIVDALPFSVVTAMTHAVHERLGDALDVRGADWIGDHVIEQEDHKTRRPGDASCQRVGLLR